MIVAGNKVRAIADPSRALIMADAFGIIFEAGVGHARKTAHYRLMATVWALDLDAKIPGLAADVRGHLPDDECGDVGIPELVRSLSEMMLATPLSRMHSRGAHSLCWAVRKSLKVLRGVCFIPQS
jgi:hypothetical protein